MATSFIPKSVTTPDRHRRVGAAGRHHVHHRGGRVIITGILGAIFALPGVEDLPREQPHRSGARIGIGSLVRGGHPKALEMGELEGASPA